MITSVFERTRVFSRIALAVVATVVFFVGGLLMSQPSSAAPGINEQINFQGRLFTSEGATVPDGVYNLQFKLYQDGSGDTAGNPGGTLEWTENHLRSASNGVTIKNGYLSVQLGSVTAFGSSVDWNQDTLWLSINIGNTTVCTITTDFDTDCGGDGEMLPMKRLSSTPFSLNSARLGGLTASEFIQSTTTLQTANIAIQSGDAGDIAAVIQGATGQTADIMQIKADGTATPLLSVSNTGGVTLQNASNSQAALAVNNNLGNTLFSVDTDNSRVVIGPVVSGQTASAKLYFGDVANVNNLWIGEQGGTDSDILQIQGKNGVQISTGTGATTALSIDNVGQATFENNDADDEKAEVVIQQNGTGDSTVQLKTQKGEWNVGVDESDRNSFKITSGNASAPTTDFGNTGTGTLNDSSNNNLINAGKYTANATGDVVSLSVYIGCSIDAAPNNKFRMALYSHNSTFDEPDTLLSESGESTLVPGWNKVPVPAAAVTNGDTYWIGYNTNGTNDSLNCYRADNSGGTNSWTAFQAFGAMPATWPGTDATNSRNPAFYATIQTSSSYDLFNNSLFELTTNGAATFQNSLDSANAFNIQNAAGTGLFTADTANMSVTVGGSVAYKKGTDYSTVGTSNNVNFGSGAIFRLTGASAQTITGIAGGVDGRTITLVNAGSQTAVLANQSGSSTAANRIITGTNGNISLLSGASISLVYDSTANRWRVVGGAAISGTGNYIQNSTSPQTADFNITGTAIAGIIQSNNIDAATAGPLTIGSTNATSISLQQDTTLAAGKSLTITGGNTASRPSSPTEGMVYFDTDTKQLLTYANGKWQSDSKTTTVIVAANDSSQAIKDGADYVADGTDDNVQINSALNAATGGRVYLAEGTYNISGTINMAHQTSLVGAGVETVLARAADFSGGLIDLSGDFGVTIRDLGLHGQKATYSAATNDGITSSGNAGYGVIENVEVFDFAGDGINLDGTGTKSSNRIVNNNIEANGGYGIVTDASSSDTMIANNNVENNGYGIYTQDANANISGNIVINNTNDGILVGGGNNTVSANTVDGNGTGINLGGFGASGANVTGNTISNNTTGMTAQPTGATISGNSFVANDTAIDAPGGGLLNITGNYFNGGSGHVVSLGATSSLIDGNTFVIDFVAFDGINVSNGDNSVITNNKFINQGSGYGINLGAGADNITLGGNTFSGGSSINDGGTNTVYTNQLNGSGRIINRTSSGFQVQDAAGSSLLTVDPTGSSLQVGSSTTDSTAVFFMLDQYNQTSDPANSVNGAMYYNSDLGKFRCYENGAWTNCIGAGAGTFADRDLNNLTATNINAALNATANDLTLQTTTSGNVVINAADSILLQSATTISGGAVSINDDSNFAVSIGGGTNTANITIGNSANTTTLGSDTINLGSATADTTIQKTAQTAANTAGNNLTIQGATGNGTGAGGVVTIQGGTGGATNGNGGNLVLGGGSGTGAGVDGLVVLSTAAFSTTTNDANCYTGGALVASSCTIALTSVNSSAGIIVGISTTDQTVTLPDPTLLTAGRIVYITAANGSSDFKLLVNGGGAGNEIAMRQNSSATMLWNGSDWTAAGASSSTTLQSAYDNTLQSAGGAELIVSKTSATNGLTIRDSSVNPVNGALLSVQTSSAAGLFSVNSNVKEYTTNSGAETAGASSSQFPAGTWSALGAATVSRYTTAGDYIATGQASVSVATTAAANDGVKNTLGEQLVGGTTYNVSFTSRLASGNFTDLEVYYSVDGTASSVLCSENEAVTLSYWKKINCTFTAPSSGITSGNALFIRQAGSTARTFYVDNASITIAADYNYASDGGVSDSGNFATNWVQVGGSTVSRSTTIGYNASDSAEVITTGANQGIKNNMSINPLPDTTYRVTAYASSTTTGFNSLSVRYSRDGGTNFVDCADYNTQSISGIVTNFTKVTCYITTDSTAPSDPDMYFIQTDATGRTFYVDNVSITLNSTTTPNVQIGGGSNGGPTTLFTLDRGASAPIASDNDALLGSMYYDTTLGKLQCYEADGWGACGSSPDNIVTISPEYTNAVLNGTGIGTMTSDLCSDALDINDGSSGQATVCGTNETYNFYKWTSPQASAQTYSIYVTYQLPNTFKEFEPSSTSLMGRTDSTNATVSYQVYRNNPTTGLTACGSSVSVSTGSVSSWQTGLATGTADPSVCGFNAGDSIVFKINTIASQNANAYVGNLGFTFSNR